MVTNKVVAPKSKRSQKYLLVHEGKVHLIDNLRFIDNKSGSLYVGICECIDCTSPRGVWREGWYTDLSDVTPIPDNATPAQIEALKSILT